MQSFAKLKLTKRNVVDWDAEFSSDQRLSGLASLRRQAPAGATSPPKGGRKNADFQSLNYQSTFFLQPTQSNTSANSLEVSFKSHLHINYQPYQEHADTNPISPLAQPAHYYPVYGCG